MYTYSAIVTKIHDADSIHLDVILEDREVDFGFFIYEHRKKTHPIKTRLLGINSPELGDPGGVEARDWLREKVPVGTVVSLETFKFPGDKYGRWLANITTPSLGDIGTALLDAGHAVLYRK